MIKMNVRLNIFLIFSLNFVNGQGLDFFGEELSFFLTKDVFTVQGIYYFANTTSAPFSGFIYYPFPDSNITELKIFNDQFQRINFTFDDDKSGVRFPVKIAPKDTVFLIVRYRQKVIKPRVEYILTSTQLWRRPLKTAHFQLVADSALHIRSFSYPPANTKKHKDRMFYTWNFKDFYPTKNFIIDFSR